MQLNGCSLTRGISRNNPPCDNSPNDYLSEVVTSLIMNVLSRFSDIISYNDLEILKTMILNVVIFLLILLIFFCIQQWRQFASGTPVT